MNSFAVAEKNQTVRNLNAAQQLINKSYLATLGNYDVALLGNTSLVNIGGDVRLFRIERLVQDNKQSVLESITAIYTALGAAGYCVFLFLDSDGRETNLYIGTRGEPGLMLGKNAGELLKETFSGHFPGSQLASLNSGEIGHLLGRMDEYKQNPVTSVTAVSSVPSLSTEDQQYFMQGLEKFIDAAENRAYQGLILAEPVAMQTLDQIRTGYEQVATQLSAISKRQYSYGIQESDAVSQNLSNSLGYTLGKSLGLTESQAVTEGYSTSEGSSSTSSSSRSTPDSKSKILSMGAVALGSIIGGVTLGPAGAIVGSQIAGALMPESTNNVGNSDTTSHSETSQFSETTTTASSQTDSETITTGVTESTGNTKTTGSSQQVTFEITDKSVEELLHKLDYHLSRVNEAKTFGGWNTAAYFVGEGQASSEALASMFLALVRGRESNTEDFALTTWKSSQRSEVLNWLLQLMHPRLIAPFKLDTGIQYLTPATLVSGKEMAIHLSLPRRSTATVAVRDGVHFGRKVFLLDGLKHKDHRELELGQIRHLWQDLNTPIRLNLDYLSSHMLVTGSTGSGKSNTVYGMLQGLDEHGVTYMVIEPAKGEYKHVFGHKSGVRVLGTNPKVTELLRINPFSFPEGTHVLEHADRLIEIFNVCWPMYAAMPAILREAILQSYQRCGWDLDNSSNSIAIDCFPTVIDLLHELEMVINASAYSQEMKSNYSGALLTRVKSLTNGLNGQIFTANELSCNELFDTNVIVDLSRGGSSETKSLITGLLILKLSEYRVHQGGMNLPLRHITVLEEAHNILGKSSGNGAEGSSIAEKSVEMLANAIAEMRTYGEGFIIADQSPSALHPAAIRNTNTKVVMRLPDENDRQQAGKSAALNDDQIDELARLPRGVAVVYQNNWQEAVQCKVSHFSGKNREFNFTENTKNLFDNQTSCRILIRWLLSSRKRKNNTFVLDKELIKSCIDHVRMTTPTRVMLHTSLVENDSLLLKPEQFKRQAQIVVELLNAEQDFLHVVEHSPANFTEFNSMLSNVIRLHLGNIDDSLVQDIQHCVVKNLSERGESYLKLYAGWSTHMRGIS